MKELIIAIVLVLVLPVGALLNSYHLTEDCDALLKTIDLTVTNKMYAQNISDEWLSLMRLAAFSTPYDLIRNTNNACEAYLTRLESDANPAEAAAALVQFKSAVRDLRRIHAFSFELIF